VQGGVEEGKELDGEAEGRWINMGGSGSGRRIGGQEQKGGELRGRLEAGRGEVERRGGGRVKYEDEGRGGEEGGGVGGSCKI